MADPLEGRERARQDYEKWADSLPKCAPDCDGDLIGLPHDDDCPMKDILFATSFDAFLAGRRSLEQERWISVEERLPKLEHGGVGLCPCLFYAESTEKQFGGYYDPIYNDWLIATEDESRRLQVMDVSHWRPRPAPPVHKGDL